MATLVSIYTLFQNSTITESDWQADWFKHTGNTVSLVFNYIMVKAKHLNIWFEPMRWFVLGHVTGIDSTTMTCQPRIANHDLCGFLAFEPIKKIYLMPQYASKWEHSKVIDMETHFFLHSWWQNHSKWCSFYCVTLDFTKKSIVMVYSNVKSNAENSLKCTE